MSRSPRASQLGKLVATEPESPGTSRQMGELAGAEAGSPISSGKARFVSTESFDGIKTFPRNISIQSNQHFRMENSSVGKFPSNSSHLLPGQVSIMWV